MSVGTPGSASLKPTSKRLEAKRQAHDADDIARGGAFLILNHDGGLRIERGFIRPEDEKRHTDATSEGSHSEDEGDTAEAMPAEDGEGDGSTAEQEDDDRPLSDSLVRDLTAHRTLGLKLNLAEQPDVAVIAITHALSAQIFYIGADV